MRNSSDYRHDVYQKRLALREEIRIAKEQQRQEELQRAKEELERKRREEFEANRKEEKKRELYAKIHRLEQELSAKKMEC